MLLKNVIQSGNFNNGLYAWGHGMYSNKIRTIYPNLESFWINFLDADINVSVETTSMGNALKIVNRSGSQPNKVGIMEQVITVTSGIYEFSFMAKSDSDLERNALQFCTTDDWVIKDSKGQARGYELTEQGAFNWKRFSRDIIVTDAGNITFSIISKGKGTIYLTDLKFERISN